VNVKKKNKQEFAKEYFLFRKLCHLLVIFHPKKKRRMNSNETHQTCHLMDSTQCFFWGNFIKFLSEKYDFNLYKRFFMKTIDPNSPDLKEKKFQIIRFFNHKLQQIVKNIQGFWFFFSTFISSL